MFLLFFSNKCKLQTKLNIVVSLFQLKLILTVRNMEFKLKAIGSSFFTVAVGNMGIKVVLCPAGSDLVLHWLDLYGPLSLLRRLAAHLP